MIWLTHKEKLWNIFFFLPCYFVFGQFLLSIMFLLIMTFLPTSMSSMELDALFNMIYLFVFSTVAVVLFSSYLKQSLSLMKGKWVAQIGYACTLGTIKFYFFNIVSSLLILLLNPGGSSTNQVMIESMTTESPLMMMITTVILAPFLEEMVFRVGIFQLIYEKSRWLAYALSSFSFGFVHIYAGLFAGDLSQLLFLLPYGLLGFVLCHLYEKRDSIFVPMIVHSLNNLIAMLVIL